MKKAPRKYPTFILKLGLKFLWLRNAKKVQFSNKILLFMRLCKDSFQIQSRVRLFLFRSKNIEIQLRKQEGKPIHRGLKLDGAKGDFAGHFTT